jgi:DNA modification methylase
MTKEFKQMVIDALRRGDELPRDWARKLFPPEKREYELVYHGKEREEDIIANTMALPLQPASTFGRNGEDWHNMLIFGDNLQAMKTLLQMKEEGKLFNADGTPGVRLIYIDPPFASRQDFRGTQDQKAYQDRISGTEFIEFMRKRLILLRELMAADGSLIIHLDSRRSHYMKVVLDELCGEHRFMNEIIWRSTVFTGSSKAIANKFPSNHQTLLWYRGQSGYMFDKPREDYKEEYLERFQNPDEDPRGPWQSVSLKTFSNKRFMELKREGRIIPPQRKGAGWRYKFYLSETKGRVVETLWLNETMANSMAEERTNYPTQKPEVLLERVVRSFTKEGDLVLDAFAGSGTTLAVAEKLQRGWIGIDCGKLAIYTIQKRMLSLKMQIGNKGKTLKPKPFTLYNAGLYDFSQLKQLPWPNWRFFALQLFGCTDEPHTVGGLSLDGKLKGASVLVFNHVKQSGKRIDEETIQNIHLAVGKKIGRKFFIIAPRGVFDFQQDYVDLDGIRYYALRIPYSVINELHHRDFTALKQPNDESAVNETVDAVGFDFIQPPQVEWSVMVKKRKGEMLDEACLKIKRFESRARIRGKDTRGGLETMSMLMLDFDYDGNVFNLDAVFYAHQFKDDEWQAWFPVEKVGEKLMAVFIDIYGNEARELITRDKLGIRSKKSSKSIKKLRN